MVHHLPRSLVARLAIAVAGLLLFFFPLLSFVPYIFVESSFTPTDALKQPADLVSYAAVFVYLALIWPGTISDVRVAWSDRKPKLLLQSAGLLFLTPVFGWAVIQAFFSGPLSYFLHNANSPELSVRQVSVVRADNFGSSRCRNRAILEERTVFWKAVVCGLSAEAIEQVRRGGRLRIEGTFSPYGLRAQRIAVAGDA